MEFFEHFLSVIKTIQVRDVIDILAIALIIFGLFRLVRETRAFQLLKGIIFLFVIYFLASLFQLVMLSSLLRALFEASVVVIVVIFQPEIRKFLLFLGTKTQLDESWLQRLQFWRHQQQVSKGNSYEAYVNACMHMSQSRTGALIVFKRKNEVEELIATGERIDALASSPLIEALFFKNSPLHDGAVIAHGNQVLAARCILPVTSRLDVDPNLGLRHRSAIGVTEQLDVLSVIVSEETGSISYAVDGEIHHDISPVQLRQALEKYEC